MMFRGRGFEYLKTAPLKQWKAITISAGQKFVWREEEITECVDSKPVHRIVRNIKRSAALRLKRDARNSMSRFNG